MNEGSKITTSSNRDNGYGKLYSLTYGTGRWPMGLPSPVSDIQAASS